MVASEICSTKMDWVYYKHAHGTAEISKSLVIKLNAMFRSVIISLADHALLVCFLCKLSQASKNVSKILHLHSSRPRRIPYTTHTHTHIQRPFGRDYPGEPVKVKPIWILLKQETVSGSGISWATCKSAPRSRQITMPTPHHSVFYRPDALPAAQPTVSKHCIP